MTDTLRLALSLMRREKHGRWILLVAVGLIVSTTEILGASLVYVLISLVTNPSAPMELPLIGNVREHTGGLDEPAILLWLVAGMAVFFVLRTLIKAGSIYVQMRVASNAGARLSAKLFEGYLRMPYSVHLRRNSSDLVRNAQQAVQQVVRFVFVPIIRVSSEGLLVLGLLSLLFALAPLATGLAVVVIGTTAVALFLIVQPRLKRVGETSHAMQRETLQWLQQSLHGIRDITTLGREAFFLRHYSRSRFKLARASYMRATLTVVPKAAIELALVGFILLFFAAATTAGGSAEGTLPVLALFAYAGLRLQPSLQIIIGGLNEIRFSTAPLQDLHRDLLTAQALDQESTDLEALPLRDLLALDRVHFRYEGSQQDALSGISLRIRRGEQIGVCGPTGGGKTTLADVITGLLRPCSGAVAIDGVDLCDHVRAWQRTLGVVPQMVYLLDDTLRRNVAFGVPDAKVDENALSEAITLAQLSTFVDMLPDGLETLVGERGVRISGGQRQRIAIARALYRRPEVLLFDEGTSALDNATEADLMAAIERLRGTHTIILIAHRLSTVRNSDRIIVVEDGRITADGTYWELASHNSSFQALANIQ